MMLTLYIRYHGIARLLAWRSPRRMEPENRLQSEAIEVGKA